MVEEESDILEETIPSDLSVKFTKANDEEPENITMLRQDSSAGRKQTWMERTILLFRLAKLIICYMLRPSIFISLSYFGLMLIPLVTLHSLSSNHHIVAGCYIISFVNITGVSVLVALISACNHKLMKHKLTSSNIILQKTVFIWLFYCLVLTALWMNCSLIFERIHQDYDALQIAKNVEYFCFLFMPGLFCLGLSLLLQSYMLLVKNETTYPIALSNLLSFVLNLLLNFVLPKESVRSAAIAADLSFACLAVFLFLWVIWEDDYKCSWTGFSWAALCDWKEVLKPFGVCLCVVIADWWVFDVVTVLIGQQRKDWLIAHAINVYVIEAIFMLLNSIAAGTTLQALESMNTGYYRRGVFIIKATLFMLWVMSLFLGGILAMCQESLIKLFSSHGNRWSYEKTLAFIAVLPYLKVSQTLGFHVKRRFNQSSFIFLMTCQLILGFPLGMFLLFFSDRGVYGIWIGYIIGMFVQMIYFLSGLYSYVREFSISRNYPKWRESLYTRDDVEDADGKSKGVTSLLLRYPHMHMRFNSIDILCSHSIDSGLENQAYVFGDSLKDVEVKTIFWRSANVIFVVVVFIAGFFIKYH